MDAREKNGGTASTTITVTVVGGEYHGVPLTLFYSVLKPPADCSELFEFPKGRSSFIRRDVIGILGEASTQLARLAEFDLEADVYTVTHDSSRNPLPENQRYSKAKRLRLKP